jgi:hypothetical protein
VHSPPSPLPWKHSQPASSQQTVKKDEELDQQPQPQQEQEQPQQEQQPQAKQQQQQPTTTITSKRIQLKLSLPRKNDLNPTTTTTTATTNQQETWIPIKTDPPTIKPTPDPTTNTIIITTIHHRADHQLGLPTRTAHHKLATHPRTIRQTIKERTRLQAGHQSTQETHQTILKPTHPDQSHQSQSSLIHPSTLITTLSNS